VAVTDLLTEAIQRLRASGFRGISGTRVTAIVPIDEALLNEIVAAALPAESAVRTLTLHPHPHDRLGVRVKLARPDFLPPIGATVVIERQPDLPHGAQLALRIAGLAGPLAHAGPMLRIGSMLPPGVLLEGDLLTVDLAALLSARGQSEWFRYVERLHVTTETGRLVVELEARVA